MDFIASDRNIASHDNSFGLAQGFAVIKGCVDIEQPKPMNGFSSTFNAMRVANAMTKHLIAAAKPQNMPAAPVMRLNINIPALIAQKPKIGNCGL